MENKYKFKITVNELERGGINDNSRREGAYDSLRSFQAI